jgi:hypothetical protein
VGNGGSGKENGLLMKNYYEVINHPFNQEHYPNLVGTIMTKPPSYAKVRVIQATGKFSTKEYNFTAKRFRENFPVEYDVDTKQDVMTKRTILATLMLDFAEHYLKDNPMFEPLNYLDRCSPNVDLFPLSELWEQR